MYFAVIAAPRTGSSHLVNLLHSRRDILCNGEVCHSKKVFVSWPKLDRSPEVLAELAALRTNSPKLFLARIFETNYRRRHVGIKILKGQNKTVLTSVIADDSIKKVILFRRNVLACYSSQLIALESGKYALASKNAAEASRQQEVLFDADDFLEFNRKYVTFYKKVIERIYGSGQNFHFVNYEEINNSMFFVMLLKFIGANTRYPPAVSKNVKQNSRNILSRFANRGTVESFVRQHDLMHWSYEGELSLELFDEGGSKTIQQAPDSPQPRA
jgi:hypothetical protein